MVWDCFVPLKFGIILSMSLSYHSEHLAWQQRVSQERTRANNFCRTTGNFFTGPSTTNYPFPNASQDLVPSNYKREDFSLAYTFGGTKPIRYAFVESPSKRIEEFRNNVRGSRSIETPEKKGKAPRRILNKYIDELKGKITEEKTKRGELEKKLKIFS